MTFKCDKCHRVFKYEMLLKVHQCVSMQESSFVCQVCNYTCKKFYNLTQHQLVHSNYKKRCEICAKAFNTEKGLKYHLKNHSAASEWALQCKECHKSFRSEVYFKYHQCLNTGQQDNFQCQICQKTCRTFSMLSRHQLSHVNENIYKCKECDQSFTTQVGMQAHFNRFHAIERPFLCEVCGKLFSSLRQLNYHKRCFCNDTPKFFFRCKLCKATFESRAESQNHTKSVHPSKIKCDHCEKLFKTNLGRKIHQAKNHAKSPSNPLESAAEVTTMDLNAKSEGEC